MENNRKNTVLIVLVASLGYFVDIYDLILFSVVRVASLKDLGVADKDLLNVGASIINSQMIGMLVGGLIWGILGDKKGRLSVLFGSIITYSLANIANGFVTSVDAYIAVRFIAGLGLAGELGAGITLVTETMSKKYRGYGTMIVAAVGLMGAVTAALIAENNQWQTSYFIGGGMGLLLLLLRIGIVESGIYKATTKKDVQKGNFFMLFNNWARLKKYLACIFIGLPTWFVVGVLITFSPEFGKALNATGPLNAGEGVMYCYIGIAIGDILAGFLAQLLQSRKKVMYIFMLFTLIATVLYLNSFGLTPNHFIWLSLFLGFASGYWATFVTISAEQFGTNLRATVTTTVPNFIRGSLVAVIASFQFFKAQFGILNGALIVGLICVAISVFAISQLQESFHKDLDYLEH